jgi:hypothetical protein
VAEDYARRLHNMQEDMKPAAYPDDTEEWTFLPLLWARYGRWHDLMDIDALPENARGLCPYGGREFAAVVWHYVRVLMYAGQADSSRSRGLPGEGVLLDTLAEKELAGLEVRLSSLYYHLWLSPPFSRPTFYLSLSLSLSLTHTLSLSRRRRGGEREQRMKGEVRKPPCGLRDTRLICASAIEQ